MNRALVAAAALLISLPVAAQSAMGSQPATPFRDTSSFKPPAGAKVAIIEFEDLECPLCAHDSPIVHAAMARYKIPRVHHDYIIPSHAWSRTAAIDARYLEDKVSPSTAEDFRRDVFASQSLIAGQDDLQQFTRKWFQARGQQMPFVVDPSGRCAAEVEADCTLGARIGVLHTPTIVVVTAKSWIEVTDASQLYAAIDRAKAEVSAPAARERYR
jgi:protein-disulfide isomerase